MLGVSTVVIFYEFDQLRTQSCVVGSRIFHFKTPEIDATPDFYD